MKKNYLMILFAALMSGAFAQSVTNGGFETWTNNAPVGWSTWGSATGILTSLCQKDTTPGNHTQGLASARVKSDTATVPGIPGQINIAGILIYGPAVYTPGNFMAPGVAYHHRIDTVYFNYKYTPVTGKPDTALFSIGLTHRGNNLIDASYLLPPTGGNFVNARIPIINDYDSSTGIPDTLHMEFTSSLDSAYQNSQLWVDSVHFNKAAEQPIVNGIEAIEESVSAKVYPSPARDIFTVEVSENLVGTEVEFTDVNGRLVRREQLSGVATPVTSSDWNAGVYQYTIRSKNGKAVSGNVSIVK